MQPTSKDICSIDGCDGAVVARGWCNRHYRRWKRNGDPEAYVRQIGPTPCRVDGCDRPKSRSGLCSSHYYRLATNAPLEGPRRKTGPKPSAPLDRFNTKWVADSNGCWVWQGPLNAGGYGVFMMSSNGKRKSAMHAHRAGYILLVGDIPADLVVDHLCRNRACVNPSHMEPVTSGTNVLRGVGPAAVNARKTCCIRGHEFTPENTYITPSDGSRVCRECNKVEPKPRRAFPHGAITRYRHGCRCDKCRGENARKAREWRARKRGLQC